MIYTGKVVAFQEGLSKLSYDGTSLICGNVGCTNYVSQMLTVPGEHIGRPGQFYRVLHCFNCMFWGRYYVYFSDAGQPLRIEYQYQDGDGECDNEIGADLEAFTKLEAFSKSASLEWRVGAPTPGLGPLSTFAGGEPDWIQDWASVVEDERGELSELSPRWIQDWHRGIIACPECGEVMVFILQLSSETMNGWRDDRDGTPGYNHWPQELGYDFNMTINYYANLYLFACDKCHVTCSITQDS